MRDKKGRRREVELSRSFITILDQALAEAPAVRAAMAGVYEGRSLAGPYRLLLTGARLVPTEAPPPAADSPPGR